MPPETHLISETTDYFAPPQVYVFLGITMATFSWLLKPDSASRIDKLGKWSLGLVAVQVVHLLFYVVLEGIHEAVNPIAHAVVVIWYSIVTATMYFSRWATAKSRPPTNPNNS